MAVAHDRFDSGELLVVAAAALVDRDGQVLVQQRPAGRPMAGLWEFPGGKVEPGETPEAALARELDEELGIRMEAATLVPAAFASAPLGDRHLLLLLYLGHHWKGEPRSLEGGAIRWVSLAALRDLAMPPADGPLIDQLARML